ncbi:MAG: A/G-specific adenine glycosylase [Candidatus Lokiarchaeia archaeon]|nr:A/G-specific adenine glycosylase [Candidatus Lokiarchaeia archaeon]
MCLKISEDLFINDFHKRFKKSGVSPEVVQLFQKFVYKYYKNHKRKFPFRENITPYNVLISEIMLQQTQTGQVTEKFLKFTKKFPSFSSLSKAPLEDILKEWKGLGYNRRAIALKKIADTVIKDFNGKLPESIDILVSFPQIGYNTASSIITFAFNKPTAFIETNIRRVYIYFFFPNRNKINDKEILPIVKKTLDRSNPRDWYYALMDYGVMLKKTHPDLNKKSTHYRKQAPFKGSTREVRGKILDLLIKKGKMDLKNIQTQLGNMGNKTIIVALNQLRKEGFLEITNEIITLNKK